MRLPPSSTAWRIAWPRRCSAAGWLAKAASSTRSMRCRQPSSLAAMPAVPAPASGIVAACGEGRGRVRLLRVGEQAHAQFGLFKGLLAAAVEADAALVRGERVLEAHVALLHLLHQLFERVERGFEVGHRGRVVFGFG